MKALTATDRKRLEHLEYIVESGLASFAEVGNALAQIKELCGYSQKEFEQYCKKRFGFGDRRGRQLIAAAKVAEDLGDVGNFVPENHARALVKLPKDKQKAAYEAVNADGKATAARITELAVKALGSPEAVEKCIEESKRRILEQAEARKNAPKPNPAQKHLEAGIRKAEEAKERFEKIGPAGFELVDDAERLIQKAKRTVLLAA